MPRASLKRTIIGQLPRGTDLLEGLTAFVRKENIRFGRIQALGATTHAVVAYYDQKSHEYIPMEFPAGMEILNLHGNISLRDNQPFVHIHVTLSDREGRAWGGHVLPGTILWALEVFIDEYTGEPPVRRKDEATGLFLWDGELLR
jgi:uncharacterized protein